MKEALQRMETKEELQMEEAEQVPQKEEPALSLMEQEQGPQMEIQLMDEAEQGFQKEEVILHRMGENQALQMEAEKGLQEVALHPIEEEQGLPMEDTLPGPVEAEQGLQIGEALAVYRMEAEQGLQMEETLIIPLTKAELAEMRVKTSRMREKRAEAEAAVEAKRNELELRKINRDQRLTQLLLLEVAEQVFLDILFPPPN